jgi:hypothetical protein
MIQRKRNRGGLILAAVTAQVIALVSQAAAGVSASYLYSLSNFNGTVPYSAGRLHMDDQYKELYVIAGDVISIFNESGMNIYDFGTVEMDIGTVFDVAVDGKGNLLILEFTNGVYSIKVCNYRGEPKSQILIKNLPPEFKDFEPNRIFYQEGKIYLASMRGSTVVVADQDGNFKEGYDLFQISGLAEEDTGSKEKPKREDNDLYGFSIDKEANMLFTFGAAGKAFVVTPDRQLRQFGKRGSGPGKFGVPAAIVKDESGNIYVSDLLRCVVIIFNKDFKYVTEFGFRGFDRDNLIGPRDLALSKDGRLYVSQLRKRGVSVFKLAVN